MLTPVPQPPPADGSPVTTALIVLFLVLGLPFGFWMMWMALESDRSHRNDFWKE